MADEIIDFEMERGATRRFSGPENKECSREPPCASFVARSSSGLRSPTP
jgi:hypothetical protein